MRVPPARRPGHGASPSPAASVSLDDRLHTPRRRSFDEYELEVSVSSLALFRSHDRAAGGCLPHTSERRARPEYRRPSELGARRGTSGPSDDAARPVRYQLHRPGRAAGAAPLGTGRRRTQLGLVHRAGIQRGVAACRGERHHITAAADGAVGEPRAHRDTQDRPAAAVGGPISIADIPGVMRGRGRPITVVSRT